MPHLYSSLAFALRENRSFLVNTSKRFRALVKKTKQDTTHCVTTDEREINFALSQCSKKVHSCPVTYKIPHSLQAELEYISCILADTDIPLHTPITIIVPRNHKYVMWADSCKQSGGGWSTGLKFCWFLEYPSRSSRGRLLPTTKGVNTSLSIGSNICMLAQQKRPEPFPYYP